MRVLTVRHVTTYRYNQSVEFGDHRLMFRPRESHDLRLISTDLQIMPRPAAIRWVHDVFDNSVAVVSFDDRSRELRFESVTTLEHIETPLPEYALAPDADMFPFEYSEDERPDLLGGLARLSPSSAVDEWALQFVGPLGSTTTMGLLHAMTRGMKHDFEYQRRTEKGVQSPAETLRLRSGSCRDFAVLMMDGVRSLGIAARFVSGYIYMPEASHDRTIGGGSTHGWMQAYLPGAGWVDFDPTNSIVGNRNLIRVAVAWDQRNALPLWGTFIGPAMAFLGMDVHVSVVEETVAIR